MDNDDLSRALFLRHDGHLIVRRERTRLLRLEAKALDRVRHFLRLIDDGVAEIAGPIEVVVQLLQHRRKAHHGFHRRVPVLRVRAGKVPVGGGGAVPLQPAMRLHDLQRIGGGRQQLGEQGVGIERDRRQQMLELRLREPWRLRLGRRVRRGLVGRRRSGRLREGRSGGGQDEQAGRAANEKALEPNAEALPYFDPPPYRRPPRPARGRLPLYVAVENRERGSELPLAPQSERSRRRCIPPCFGISRRARCRNRAPRAERFSTARAGKSPSRRERSRRNGSRARWCRRGPCASS